MASDVNAFFYPRTVALIGATDKETKPGRAILENLSHFSGAVYPVNPKHETLLGHRCYPSIQAVPEAVDLAVVALPAPLVEQEIEAIHRKGIRNVIIISSGFAESGDAGRDEQQRIRDKVRQYGMRVIGPERPRHLQYRQRPGHLLRVPRPRLAAAARAGSPSSPRAARSPSS